MSAVSAPPPAPVSLSRMPQGFGALRRVASTAKTALVELQGHRAALAERGSGPRVAFFEQNGSPSHLRSARMAEALRPRGWSAISVPARLSVAQRLRVVRSFAPDLVVLQQCRHPGDRPEHLAGLNYVLDLDDADFLDPRHQSNMEAVARDACGVIAGSRFLAEWARGHNATTEIIWTGSQPTPGPRPPQSDRAPIVTWAQASPLRYKRELAFVTDVARAARRSGAEFTLRLYGWSETPEARAALATLTECGVAVETLPPMPYPDFLKSLQDCAVGLSAISPDSAFSQGKSFGKILGYLDAKVPVICSDAADHAVFFARPSPDTPPGAPPLGIVSNDPAVWVTELQTLLADAATRQRMADAAFDAFVARLSLDAAADRTDRFLRSRLAVLSTPPTPPSP